MIKFKYSQCFGIFSKMCFCYILFALAPLRAQSDKVAFMDSIRGYIRETTNNPNTILQFSDSLAKKAKNDNEIYRYAGFLLVKGMANSQLGNRTEALSCNTRSYAIFDSLRDNTGRAMSLSCLAFTHMEMHNYNKARYYFLQAKPYVAKEDLLLNNNIDVNLGIIYYYFKEYKKSIESYTKALIYYKSTKSHYATAITYHALGCSYQKLNNIDKAIEYELIALEYQKRSKSKTALAMIATYLGSLYLEKGEMDLAKKYLEIGGKEAYKINAPNLKRNYLQWMMRWYKVNNEMDKAFDFSERYIHLKDSIYTIDSTATVAEIEERFQNRLKTNEIKLLKTQKKLDAAEAYETKVWSFVLVVIAILFSIIILVLYRNYQLSKKAKALLESERTLLKAKNEQLEIENILVQFETLKHQISPHFLFNSLNALISLIKTDTQKAIRFTNEFSKIFRNALELKERNLITLREELEHVQAYLYLQKMRFGSNLIVNTAIDKACEEDYLLPFSLQMVIENAIKHNEISNEKPLNIDIETRSGFLVVSNTLQSRKNIEASTQTGVANIKSRYKYITDEQPTFEILNNIFKVKLPLVKEAQ